MTESAGCEHLFNHIDEPMRIMCGLLQHGRAPAELPQVLAEREVAGFSGIGRHDPCACGRGERFEKS